ncbi:hypothetical protein [Bradyrhizobium sp.]|jgi:hypothetical protein|nr:hypothetical protein [Bradyrhizobium sp.]
MSRWVVPGTAGLKAGTPGGPDGPAGRIVKYIPGEVVSAFTLIFTGLVSFKFEAAQAKWAAVGLIVLFLIVTIVYVARNTSGVVRTSHLIVSPLAFVAWAYPVASSVLGDFFIGLVAFGLQAIVIALSLFIVPRT